MGIFELLDDNVNEIVLILSRVVYFSAKAQQLLTILTTAIALYVLYKGYLILAGKTQEPIRDLLWDIIAKVLIIGIIQSYSYWGVYISDIVKGLSNWASLDGGTTSLAQVADDILATEIEIDSPFFSADTALYPFLVLAKWIGLGIGFGVSFFILFIAKITLQLLILIAPVMIYCKLFGFMSNMFMKWVQLVLANILTVLFLSFVMLFSFKFVGAVLSAMANHIYTDNSPQLMFDLMLAGIMQAMLAKLAVSMAHQIASASLEVAGINAATETARLTTHAINNKLTRAGSKAIGNIAKNADRNFRQWKDSLFNGK